MTVYEFAVTANQARDLETELTKGSTHAIDRSVVLPRIARILT